MRESRFHFGVRCCFKISIWAFESFVSLFLPIVYDCSFNLFDIPIKIWLRGDFIRRMCVLVLWGGRFAIPRPSGIMKRKQEDLNFMRSQSRPVESEHNHLRWLTLDQPVIYCTSRCAALLRNQGDYGMLTVGRTPSERDSKGHSKSLERFLHVRPFFCLLCVVDCSAWTVHLIFILYYFLLAPDVYHGNNSRWGDTKNGKCCSLHSCFHLFDFAAKTTDWCNNQTNSPKTPTA